MSLDATKAVDKVTRPKLIEMILDIPDMETNDKRSLCNYVTDRRASVQFGSKYSRWRIFKNGVPQGGVLSPQLFNFYVSKCCPPPSDIMLLSYADDFVVMSKGTNVNQVEERLQRYGSAATSIPLLTGSPALTSISHHRNRP